MASKKYTWMLGLLGLVQSAAFSQNNSGMMMNDASSDWWKDSSKVPSSKMPQYNEFLNNQYPYPAKPRNMWELGINAGYAMIAGDVKSVAGIGGGISLRKALSHTFSIRAGYQGSVNIGEPNAYEASTAGGNKVKYINQTQQLNLDLITSLNSISHYRGNPNVDWYLVTGYSLIGTRVLYENPAGQELGGGYSQFYGYTTKNTYQGTQENTITTLGGTQINGRHAVTLLHGAALGMGVSFKVSPRFNLGVEQRFTFTAYDYLDAQSGGQDKDFYSYSNVHLNFNLGSAATHVEPLWWINPNNFIYNELNIPKHMKIPPPVLPDADGDGVTDQFDLEPNTPAGCPVDTHGVSRDTDGDGVPDCRDKEPLTPLSCFPVNADGVGNCPEPACCKELRDRLANQPAAAAPTCAIAALPSVTFKKGSVSLTSAAKSLLAQVAGQLNANPNCNVKVTGYGASSKSAQQLSWDRVNSVIRYLVEKQGISEARLINNFGQEGDVNTVDLMGTMDAGGVMVPAPHPNLRK